MQLEVVVMLVVEKLRIKAVEFYFMTLTVLKNGGAWDFLTSTFQIRPPTFQRNNKYNFRDLGITRLYVYFQSAYRLMVLSRCGMNAYILKTFWKQDMQLM